MKKKTLSASFFLLVEKHLREYGQHFETGKLIDFEVRVVAVAILTRRFWRVFESEHFKLAFRAVGA
jgi:hypothetical protein